MLRLTSLAMVASVACGGHTYDGGTTPGLGGQFGQGVGGDTANGGYRGDGGQSVSGVVYDTGGVTSSISPSSQTGGNFGHSGGLSSSGGASGVGATLSTGGVNGSAGCGPNPYGAAVLCSSDSNCPITAYCQTGQCWPPNCICAGTAWICSALCLNSCVDYSTNCTPVDSAVTDQLTGDACTVVVRINAAGTTINGYIINCAPHASTTESDALNQLLIMSSINWSGATSIADAATGLYAFTVSDANNDYVAYFSRASGKLLLITQTPSTGDSQGEFRMFGSWGPATDLGTTCAAGLWPPTAVPIGGDTADSVSAVHLLQGTDIVPALRKMELHVSELAATSINVAGPETLLFLSTTCPTC